MAERETNPLKGTTKDKTRRSADRADPEGGRVPVEETETGQGGSRKGGGEAHSPHPSEHGGVKEELPEHEPPGRGA